MTFSPVGVVVDEPRRPNGRTRFTCLWVSDGWRRAQCFDAILEDYLRKDGWRLFGTEAAAKESVGWEGARTRQSP